MLETLHVVGAAIIHGQSCLVGMRPQGGSSGGKWEFPGGKVEPNEDPETALLREIQEELGVDVLISGYLARGSSISGTRQIVLDVYEVRLKDNTHPIECREHVELRFIQAHDVDQLDWAEADRPALAVLKQLLMQGPRLELPPLVLVNSPQQSEQDQDF